MPEKETAKMFVTGLKPDLFPEEFYSRNCEMLQEAMDESRAELSSYLDILEITDRINKADVKKEKRDPPFSDAIVKKVADTKASEWPKSIHQICIRFSDLTAEDNDFLINILD